MSHDMPSKKMIKLAFFVCSAMGILFTPAHGSVLIPPQMQSADQQPLLLLDIGSATDDSLGEPLREQMENFVGHEPNPMLNLLEDPRRHVIVGNLAFAANLEHGLMVLDMSDPTKPELIGQYDTPGISLGVAMVGSTVFIADGFGGLVLVDARDPADLKLLGQQDSTGYAYGVSVINEFAFLTQFGAPTQKITLHLLELPCQADLVKDGVLDIADIAFFSEAYDNRHPLADMNNDGVFDFYDISIFFELFTAGCP